MQVDGTDRGTQIGEPEKRAIDEIVAKLETLCIPEPLSSPLLFGGTVMSLNPKPHRLVNSALVAQIGAQTGQTNVLSISLAGT